MNLNLAFAKLGAEAFEQANRLVIELNGQLPVSFLKAQQAVVFGEQVVPLPHATHPTGTDVDTLQSPFTAAQFVEQSLGTISLVITGNFVGLLTVVADELAGFADVIELFGEL